MTGKPGQPKQWLRTCGSCEYIYVGMRPCPKCGFAHYGAVFCYGVVWAILYWITQGPYKRPKEKSKR